MKTPEELNALNEEVETLNEDELAQVAGGKENSPKVILTYELKYEMAHPGGPKPLESKVPKFNPIP